MPPGKVVMAHERGQTSVEYLMVISVVVVAVVGGAYAYVPVFAGGVQDLALDVKELQRFLAQDAQIAVSPGYWFGREGAGFARMTIGCPRLTLHQALNRLAGAVERLS